MIEGRSLCKPKMADSAKLMRLRSTDSCKLPRLRSACCTKSEVFIQHAKLPRLSYSQSCMIRCMVKYAWFSCCRELVYWCIDLQPEYAIALAADQARNEREEWDRATTEARVVSRRRAGLDAPASATLGPSMISFNSFLWPDLLCSGI